jgi:hypothetical protein
MKTKQEIERKILELNAEYNKRKEELEHKLFELFQLEKEMQSHTMKHEIDFYIDIFKYLLQLEDTYCRKGDEEYSCDECKLCTQNHVCIKNWLIGEFDEFTRQAKLELQGEKK